MRRKRLRDSGYGGAKAPVDKDKIVEGLTASEVEDLKAWAEGVWKRQAEQSVSRNTAKSDLERLRLVARGDGGG